MFMGHRAFVFVCLLAVLGCAAATARADTYRNRSIDITSINQLDLARYMGRWYEIARYPVWFEEGCHSVTADYHLKPNGRIGVTNSCRQDAVDGPLETADGEAWVTAPGQLKVSFVPIPFLNRFLSGDYWILYLAEDYSLAVIGSPKGSTGWILARQPNISASELDRAHDALAQNGYDLSALHYTLHVKPQGD